MNYYLRKFKNNEIPSKVMAITQLCMKHWSVHVLASSQGLLFFLELKYQKEKYNVSQKRFNIFKFIFHTHCQDPSLLAVLACTAFWVSNKPLFWAFQHKSNLKTSQKQLFAVFWNVSTARSCIISHATSLGTTCPFNTKNQDTEPKLHIETFHCPSFG